MARFFILAAVLFLLSGCADNFRVAEPAAPYEESAQALATVKAAKAARAAADDEQCRSYGAKPGTSSYTNCRLALDKKRDEYDAQRRAEMHQQAEAEEARQRCRSRALMVAGAAMMASQSPNASDGVADGIQQGAEFAQASGC
jgi:hypothetical protein